MPKSVLQGFTGAKWFQDPCNAAFLDVLGVKRVVGDNSRRAFHECNGFWDEVSAIARLTWLLAGSRMHTPEMSTPAEFL